MEQRRIKITLLFGLLTLLFVILLGWYSQIDKVDIKTIEDRTYLTDNEKYKTFEGVDLKDYDAFYEKTTVYKKTKTKIPFVYNEEILQETPLKLYTKKR